MKNFDITFYLILMQDGEYKENCLLRELTNGILLNGYNTSGTLNKGDIECLNEELICLINCIAKICQFSEMFSTNKYSTIGSYKNIKIHFM